MAKPNPEDLRAPEHLWVQAVWLLPLQVHYYPTSTTPKEGFVEYIRADRARVSPVTPDAIQRAAEKIVPMLDPWLIDVKSAREKVTEIIATEMIDVQEDKNSGSAEKNSQPRVESVLAAGETPDGQSGLLPPTSVQVTFCGTCGQTGLHNTRCSKCGNHLFFSDEITYTRSSDASKEAERGEEAAIIERDHLSELIQSLDEAAGFDGEYKAVIGSHVVDEDFMCERITSVLRDASKEYVRGQIQGLELSIIDSLQDEKDALRESLAGAQGLNIINEELLAASVDNERALALRVTLAASNMKAELIKRVRERAAELERFATAPETWAAKHFNKLIVELEAVPAPLLTKNDDKNEEENNEHQS